MTSEQLRSIFHVESQDLVPHYEVIHLTHHGTTEHSISKRSIATKSSLSSQNNQFGDVNAHQKLGSHHVKKDLSKSAYYSELKKESLLPVSSKWSAPNKFTNLINSELNHSNNINSFSSNSQSILVKNSLSDSDFDIQNENEYKQQFKLPSETISTTQRNKIGNSDSNEQSEPNSYAHLNLANIKEHNVSINVFGKMLNLTLRPTTQLFKNGPQSLQMYMVNVSPNATHGLSYEPIEQVSFFCYFSFIKYQAICFEIFFSLFKTVKF